ncbi:MAG: hypothetical protein Q7K11_01630 [Candidatus Berkelbacteria bacterium]|nr:hypothetical protein [Candidatus Berkelbacteria bacterium]
MSYQGQTDSNWPIWGVLIGLSLALITIITVVTFVMPPIKGVEPTIFALSAEGGEAWFKRETANTVSGSMKVTGVLFDPSTKKPNGVIINQAYRLKVQWPAAIVFDYDGIGVQPVEGGNYLDKGKDTRCVNMTNGSTSLRKTWACTEVMIDWTAYSIEVYPDLSVKWFPTRPTPN